ncbi:MAG: SDR family NAD(P)-dependent oxidoreductase [Leptospirales bacterium]|nr:SDR family NAD(P)-dependent oxidoreductase [Leptospirales bacterium]
MSNEIAVVTGSYGGLGAELCKLLAGRGIKLLLADRDLNKSKAFAEQLNAVYPGSTLQCFAVDLSNHASIKQSAAQILASYPQIDYLFNNAGVLVEALQFSTHGNEMHFEVNTLAALQMTDALRPALARSGRGLVINTTAGLAAKVKDLSFEELVSPKAEFKKLFGPYVVSKQALNVLTAALARELAAENTKIRAADPGPNKTKMTKGSGTPLWMRLFYFALPSARSGAKKIYDAAFDARWNEQSGIAISGKKTMELPPALASDKFQDELLRLCRLQAAR